MIFMRYTFKRAKFTNAFMKIIMCYAFDTQKGAIMSMKANLLKKIGTGLQVAGTLCSMASGMIDSKVMRIEMHDVVADEVSRQLNTKTYYDQVNDFRQKAMEQLAEANSKTIGDFVEA